MAERGGLSTCCKKANKLSGFQTGRSGLLYHPFVPPSTPVSGPGSVHPAIGVLAARWPWLSDHGGAPRKQINQLNQHLRMSTLRQIAHCFSITIFPKCLPAHAPFR